MALPKRLILSTSSSTSVSPIATLNKTKQARELLKEKIGNWKKKAWLDYCKLVMEQDSRWTLLPLSDYNTRAGNNGMLARVTSAEGVFSNFCLTRTGVMNDIYLIPCEPMLGVMIDAGSKYAKCTVTAFPSKGMVWPVLRIADELERQYSREIAIETNKHGSLKGGTDAKRSSNTDSNGDVDKLSTSDPTDGQ